MYRFILRKSDDNDQHLGTSVYMLKNRGRLSVLEASPQINSINRFNFRLLLDTCVQQTVFYFSSERFSYTLFYVFVMESTRLDSTPCSFFVFLSFIIIPMKCMRFVAASCGSDENRDDIDDDIVSR